ncbi:MAG TPA: DUF3558 family protein [Candidatus Limnocylindrales bacterium]|nr:DUF3558 family protein [Candidatus Limnocylindrales bacterium]
MLAHSFRPRRLALVAMTVLSIAACGGGGAAATAGPNGTAATTAAGPATQPPVAGGTQQPGGGATVDACAFLTDADIKAVTGYAVSAKRNGAQVGVFQSGCEWELVAPGEIVPPSIVLGILTEGGKAYYEKYVKPYNTEQNATPVAVGDEAVDAGFGVIQGVQGDAFFNLQYLGQDDHELELAKKLVTHL